MLTNLKSAKLLLVLTLCLLGLAQSMFGAAATVAYVWPVTGVTAPTAGQSKVRNMVVADITWAAAADTAVPIVHNLQLGNATGLQGIPKVTWACTSMGAGSFVPTIAFTDANTLTIDKNSTAANTTGVCRFWVERPFSPTR